MTYWTEEQEARLTEMWLGGSSGGEIAKVLGTSRNAAIGKAHRLGLKGKQQPGQRAVVKDPRGPNRLPVPRIRAVRAKKAAPVSQTPPKPKPAPAPVIWQGASVSFVSRTGRQCVYPVSGEPGPEMQCCGRPATVKRYCTHHYGIVYVAHRPNLEAIRPSPRRAA